jgi:hypothetical protein
MFFYKVYKKDFHYSWLTGTRNMPVKENTLSAGNFSSKPQCKYILMKNRLLCTVLFKNKWYTTSCTMSGRVIDSAEYKQD